MCLEIVPDERRTNGIRHPVDRRVAVIRERYERSSDRTIAVEAADHFHLKLARLVERHFVLPDRARPLQEVVEDGHACKVEERLPGSEPVFDEFADGEELLDV